MTKLALGNHSVHVCACCTAQTKRPYLTLVRGSTQRDRVMDQVASPTSAGLQAIRTMRPSAFFPPEFWPMQRCDGLLDASIAASSLLCRARPHYSLPQKAPCAVSHARSDHHAVRVLRTKAEIACQAGVEGGLPRGFLVRRRTLEAKRNTSKSRRSRETAPFAQLQVV